MSRYFTVNYTYINDTCHHKRNLRLFVHTDFLYVWRRKLSHKPKFHSTRIISNNIKIIYNNVYNKPDRILLYM